jgi:lysophospholipase L1-like esterase
LKKHTLPILASALLTVFASLSTVALFSGWQSTRAHRAYAAGRPHFDRGYYLPDKTLGWRQKPNLEIRDQKSGELIFHTDAFGFRNRENTPDRSPIVLLGDSFVQGYYLRHDQTVGAQLEKLTTIPVYNAGVGGFSTDQEYLVGKELLEKFQPTHVFLLFFFNDLPYLDKDEAWGMRKSRFRISRGQIQWNQLLRQPDATDLGPIFSPRTANIGRHEISELSYRRNPTSIFGKLFLQNLILCLNFLSGRHSALQMDSVLPRGRAYLDPHALDSEWDLAFQFFVKLRDQAESKKCKLTVFFIPEMEQILSNRAEYFEPQRRFVTLCDEQKLNCIEPHEAFLKAQSEIDLYFRDDGHFSEAGAGLTAKILEQNL